MCFAHQDETAIRPELTPAGNALHVTQLKLSSESTPADLAYTSAVKTFEEVRYHLGKEMNGRWLGAMPVNAFLDEYIPATEEQLPDLPQNPFESVPKDGVESSRYVPFMAAIEGWMPHLQAVNTNSKGDTANNLKLKMDISIYNRVEGVAPPDRTDFSRMELWVEFKAKNDGAPFQDPHDSTEKERLLAIENGSFTPDTAEGNQARGQLAHYAGAQHSLQFRHFSFSIAIQGDHARFLRWDPSATVVTAAFNYRTHSRLMAEFLWRERGHDVSIQSANLAFEVNARVREQLGIEDEKIPLYKYEVPGLIGMGHAYGARPPTENRSLVGRCTRSLPVVWIPAEDVISDTRTFRETDERDPDQRTDSPGVEVMPEHEIMKYSITMERQISQHIVAGGDVDGGRTQMQELADAPWLCVRPRISPYQHYRLVHRIVGRPLFKFECTKQLVTAVFNALQAHSHAFKIAKILHRDISAGNIILTDEGKGLLIDWELAKMVDEGGSRRPDRTGTWQFMSAKLLWNPGKVHTLTDDLESFLHVLGWMTLRYVPASDTYLAFHRGIDMAMFDEHYQQQGHSEQGGHQKSRAFRAGDYPSSTFQPRCKTPLFDLLMELSSPFKSLYAKRPPTAEDREKINIPNSQYDEELEDLSRDIRRYDRDIGQLHTSTWFLNEIQKTLNREDWPVDDKADESLPIAFSCETRRQTQNRTNQLRNTHSLWERSKGLSGNSKRAASPTPEPSAKRRRGTPVASGTQS
ncbi:hypothetical protein HD554DRAFT_2329373 [Boletus coccyginus]|nr:hypothetical protein HD554DRAFT_2329373 [Boletus coccyginus]